MKETIRYGLILGIICFLASGLLSVVNGITQVKINLQKEQAELSGLKEVMPKASVFKPKIKNEKVIYYLVYNNKHKLDGFVIRSESRGYSSDIEVLAGLNLNLEIDNIKILSHNETPGIGSRILENTFLSQFKRKNLDNLNQVQAITGATISSSSLTNALKNKISELKSQLLQEIHYER